MNQYRAPVHEEKMFYSYTNLLKFDKPQVRKVFDCRQLNVIQCGHIISLTNITLKLNFQIAELNNLPRKFIKRSWIRCDAESLTSPGTWKLSSRRNEIRSAGSRSLSFIKRIHWQKQIRFKLYNAQCEIIVKNYKAYMKMKKTELLYLSIIDVIPDDVPQLCVSIH